jgi:hypothetical protein
MKAASNYILLFLIGIVLTIAGTNSSSSFSFDSPEDMTENSKEGAGDDGLVQENPNYVEPNDNDDTEPDDEDYDHDDDDFELSLTSVESVKKELAKTMAKSRKQTRRTIKFAKKNRAKITLVLSVFAFRREIRQVLIYLVTTKTVDPYTGKTHLHLPKINLTAVLKIVIFVDFMRRAFYQPQEGGDQKSQLAEFLLLGNGNSLLQLLLSKMIRPPTYNPTHIPPIEQHYTFERINERYIKDGLALQKAINAKHEGLKWPASDSPMSIKLPRLDKVELSQPSPSNGTVIIMDLTKIDSSFSTMETLRDQVSFLLSEYRAVAMNTNTAGNSTEEPETVELEVIALVTSPGGSAADFGLAAQQLLRLRNEHGIKLTVCVDTVAASGGYMIACTSSPGQLFAAPFSVVGSIGVIGQTVNIHKVLEGWGVTPLVFRGGKDKAPVGLIGEVTSDGKEKVQQMVGASEGGFGDHACVFDVCVSFLFLMHAVIFSGGQYAQRVQEACCDE